LYSADHFQYLNQSGCYNVDGMDDVAEYQAMRVCGLCT
jgi:myosin heavy subunit